MNRSDILDKLAKELVKECRETLCVECKYYDYGDGCGKRKMLDYLDKKGFLKDDININIEVDTLVRVRDVDGGRWVLRYFAKYIPGDEYPYRVWSSGATSVTAADTDATVEYRYCEVVDDNNV